MCADGGVMARYCSEKQWVISNLEHVIHQVTNQGCSYQKNLGNELDLSLYTATAAECRSERS